MAETKREKAAAEDEEREPTRRVVLRRERVLVLPESLSDEDVQSILKAVQDSKKLPAPSKALTHAWMEIGTFTGASKDNAIEAHAGKAGTPDAKLGEYKAPTASAWAGGTRYKAPPKPLAEKEAID
jgi:hypothetical protein